ncbi:hypothetical protein, partial [Oscillibacter sp.]|uniref:hypothetical protein n=1 Tax=Oscillibacter sp. TaxID=1945593 RepID=UPI0028977557
PRRMLDKSFFHSYRKSESEMNYIDNPFLPSDGAACTRIMGRVFKPPEIVGFICFPPLKEML